jgi:hypothetical protein
LPGALEYATGAGIGEGFTVAAGGGLVAAGAVRAGSARKGSARKGAVPRSPPLGGGLESVTADYPL